MINPPAPADPNTVSVPLFAAPPTSAQNIVSVPLFAPPAENTPQPHQTTIGKFRNDAKMPPQPRSTPLKPRI